jgi:hypothetical protein
MIQQISVASMRILVFAAIVVAPLSSLCEVLTKDVNSAHCQWASGFARHLDQCDNHAFGTARTIRRSTRN